VQQDILYAMGFKDYGFIDHDLKSFLLSIPPDTSIDEVRESVRQKLVEIIITSVDSGRTTSGLKLDDLLTQNSGIAERADRIHDLRKAEMEQVRVGVKENDVDLRELWTTAYGGEILSRLDMRIITDQDGLEHVRHIITELGFELKTGETSLSGVDMSDELKEAIWWIVKNKGRPWREIDRERDRERELKHKQLGGIE
jgi:hypothetical protein